MLTRWKPLNWSLALIVGTPALVSFLFLGQSDLAHTVFSSYSITQGHLFDFYDYNREIFVGNDYLPFVYLIFSVWMSPLVLFGMATSSEQFGNLQLNIQEIIWAKLGISIVLIFSVQALNRIAKQIWGNKSDGLSGLLMLSSPLTILAVFALGQFDIVGILFALLGFERWLKKDLKGFVFLFAIAISFKYFAVIVFFILVLFGRDHLYKKILQFLAGLLFVGLQILLFTQNEAFRENLFSQASRVLSLESSEVAILKIVSILIVAAVITSLVQRRPVTSDQLDAQLAISSIIVVLSVFFVLIKWNPQWLIYLVPFWALAANFVRGIRLFIAVQGIGFVGLMFMLANIWTNNLDESMAQKGPLSFLLPERSLKLTDFYAPNLLFVGVGVIYLSIVVLAVFIFYESRTAIQSQDNLHKATNETLVGIFSFTFVGALLIPILSAYYIPPSIAQQYSDVVNYNRLERIALGQFHSETLQIPVGLSVRQSLPLHGLGVESPIQAVEVDLFIGDGATVDIQITQGSRLLGSISAIFTERNPNSFPGFGGWTTVTVPIKASQAKEVQPEMAIKATSGQEIGVWIDTNRPEKVQLRDGYGKLVPGSISLRLLK